MSYFSEISQRHYCDVGTLFPNNSEFLVCLSFCQLAYFLTEIRQIQGYLKFWMRYLSDFSGDIPEMLVHLLKMILNKLSSAQISLRSGQFYLQLRTSSAQLGLAQKSSAFIWYLVCIRLALKMSSFIKYLVSLKFEFGFLILIWSQVFDTKIIRIQHIHVL